MLTRFFAAALLCALFVMPASARDRHMVLSPECNVTMPCELAGAYRTRSAANTRVISPRMNTHSLNMRTHERAPQAFLALSGNNLVDRARAYLGRTGPSLGLPARLWCADFMNMVTGGGTGSRLAKSWLSHQRASPMVGVVVVTGRKGGGHVGIVSGFTSTGDPIVISGNNNHRVGESVIRRSRVLAWVSP
jgi:multidrug efflux pump subunit AcrA (membrane-fusion protein)